MLSNGGFASVQPAAIINSASTGAAARNIALDKLKTTKSKILIHQSQN
jgi:hypothetical protein